MYLLLALLFAGACAVPVSFPSSAPSGNVTIFGELHLPANSVGKPPIVLLVHGSGPNDRHERFVASLYNTDAKPHPRSPLCGLTQVNTSSFDDIVPYFTTRGVAVLVYDKRTCCNPTRFPKCAECKIIQVNGTLHYTDSCYYGCFNEPQKIDLNKVGIDDFTQDALSALIYLRSRDDIDATQMSIIGHSQGSNIAPYVASLYNNKYSPFIKNVVMLNGEVQDYGLFSIAQYHRIVQRCKTVIDVCQKLQPESPLIPSCNDTINAVEQYFAPVEKFYEYLRAGLIPSDRVYCAPTCTSGYWYTSQFKYSSVAWNEQVLLDSSISTVNILSVNSPTDMNIPHDDYQAIITLLKKRSAVAKGRSESVVYDNLTHFDTPADFSSNTMSEKVLSDLHTFLTK